jgi:prepilin-type N-terminal cleavage/methylation domain-containing protein
MSRRSGFTLLEVMIALGVAAVGLLALASWAANMSRQQQMLSQKMITLEVNSGVQSLMNNMSQCTFNTKNLAWPHSTPPAAVSLANGLWIYNTLTNAQIANVAKVGLIPSGYGLSIKDIELVNIQSIGTGSYSADLQIDFSTPFPLNPVRFPNVILATAQVGGNDQIQNCGVAAANMGFTGVLPAGVGSCQNGPLASWQQVPGGFIGAQRNCIAFIEYFGKTYRYNSAGCYYNPTDGWIYGCSGDDFLACGYFCTS